MFSVSIFNWYFSGWTITKHLGIVWNLYRIAMEIPSFKPPARARLGMPALEHQMILRFLGPVRWWGCHLNSQRFIVELCWKLKNPLDAIGWLVCWFFLKRCGMASKITPTKFWGWPFCRTSPFLEKRSFQKIAGCCWGDLVMLVKLKECECIRWNASGLCELSKYHWGLAD